MRLSITFFLFFISSIVFSQVTEFRVGDKEFLSDVENYIKPYDKPLAKQIREGLEVAYSNAFDSKQKETIVGFSNDLLKKKVKLKPHFISYFNSIIGYSKSESITKEEFENWSGLMTKLLKSKNKKRLTDFLTFSDNLFSKNLLASSSSVKWKLTKGTYTFSYKNGVFVEFKNSDFVCLSKNDSSTIYGTNGILNVSTRVFLGNKGQLTWERVELPKNETYAELSKYRINLKSAGFGADSVTLYTSYLSNPIKGKLLEKVITYTTKSKVRYPLFRSYDQEVELNNLLPNVDYKGAFSLEGMNFRGGAVGKNKASLIFKKDNAKFIEISSKEVEVNQEKVTVPNASAKIYVKPGEVITQSVCNFTYSVSKKLAVIAAIENKSIDNPYESSFHKMLIHAQSLTWQEGEEFLTFGSIQSLGKSKVTFESQNYFNSRDYNKFELGNNNLIQNLYDYQLSFEENYEISGMEFASYSKSLLSEISNYLVEMSNLGLIHFNTKSKTIIIKPKLLSYIEGMSVDGDYDDMFIISISDKQENAVLDLKTLELSATGVKRFDLSKRKFVRIYPRDSEIRIGKNRTVNFSGTINAGRTEYFGSDIKFDYDDFSLKFENMDTMRIRVYPLDNNSEKRQLKLLSKLHNLKGQITIDGEGNKSGKSKKFGHYPVLYVDNNPKIFYDNPEIYKGIYNRENFYFEVAPFEMDSLLTFSSAGIQFSGTLYSADIFPPLEREVKLMKDYVLGFSLKSVSENIYKSPGKYDNKLELTTKGLTGKGDVSFITSKATSELITFFPDSLVAKVGVYINKSQTLPNVPDVLGKNCLITFQPRKGIWKAKNLDSTMSLYNDGVSNFNGELTLTKDKMTAKGIYSSNRVEVNSEEFILGQKNVQAENADFKLTGLNKNDPPSLEATNLQMNLNYEDRKGEFVSNTKTSVIGFPLNKFKAEVDGFDWEMDKNIMNFKKVIDTANFQNFDENKNLIPNFVSTKDEQFKLGFFSGIAAYYIDSNSIVCKKIPYVVVADSRIIPNNGSITILKNAEIVTLENATIISNFTTKYHHFTKAEVEIESSKNYYANGNYQVSSDESINSKVFFSNIEPNAEGISVAEGTITEDSNFYLSPQFRYFGKIKVKGSDIGVEFDGQTKIITKCEDLAVDWIQFNSVIDTSKIIIPLGDFFKDKVSGPTFSKDEEVEFYTAFLADKKYEADEAITPADGYLSYNKKDGLFEISSKEKLTDNKTGGNYISFDDETCGFTSIGDLNIAQDLNQMKVRIVGEMNYNELNDTTLTMNASMQIEFPINMQAMGQMYQEMKATPVMELINMEKTNYDIFLNQVLEGKNKSANITQFYTNGVFPKFPKELMSKITLFDLKFYWDKNSQSFLSQGMANVATIGANQVYKRCKVYVQIEKRKTGDRIGFLIEYKPQGFYYFYYKNGELQTYSTDKKFVNIIQSTPAKDKKVKGKKNEEDFYYGLSSVNKPLLFMRNFQSDLEDRFDEEEEDEEEENEDMNDDYEDEDEDMDEEDDEDMDDED